MEYYKLLKRSLSNGKRYQTEKKKINSLVTTSIRKNTTYITRLETDLEKFLAFMQKFIKTVSNVISQKQDGRIAENEELRKLDITLVVIDDKR